MRVVTVLILVTAIANASSAAPQTYAEDFEDGPGGGFDPLFAHDISSLFPPDAPWWVLEGGGLWLAPAMDEVTFSLAPGEYVDWAGVTVVDWCRPGCTRVDFVGTLDSATFSSTTTGSPEVFTTTDLDLGEIVLVRLISSEAWFDDLTIDVACSGDRNGDGFVGQGDLDIVLAQWGRTGPEITDPRADTNGDEFVGQYDLDTVLEDWGQGTAPPVVPEPATLGMFALGGIALLRRKRKSRGRRC